MKKGKHYQDITNALPKQRKTLKYIRSISEKQIDTSRLEYSLDSRDSFRMERCQLKFVLNGTLNGALIAETRFE
jgi:hypothetical protein